MARCRRCRATPVTALDAYAPALSDGESCEVCGSTHTDERRHLAERFD